MRFATASDVIDHIHQVLAQMLVGSDDVLKGWIKTVVSGRQVRYPVVAPRGENILKLGSYYDFESSFPTYKTRIVDLKKIAYKVVFQARHKDLSELVQRDRSFGYRMDGFPKVGALRDIRQTLLDAGVSTGGTIKQRRERAIEMAWVDGYRIFDVNCAICPESKTIFASDFNAESLALITAYMKHLHEAEPQ